MQRTYYYDLSFCHLSTMMGGLYQRASILGALGLTQYRLSIDHQASILDSIDLEESRALTVKANSSRVNYNKDAFIQKESEALAWTALRRKFSDEFIDNFNHKAWLVWEHDREVLLKRFAAPDDLKLFKSRVALVKNVLKEKSGFKFTAKFSKYGNIVFAKEIVGDFSAVIFIDTGNLHLKHAENSFLEISLGVFEKLPNGDIKKHFLVGFDCFYPIAEGVFRSYRKLKSDRDLYALVLLHITLWDNIEDEFMSNIRKDLKVMGLIDDSQESDRS